MSMISSPDLQRGTLLAQSYAFMDSYSLPSMANTVFMQPAKQPQSIPEISGYLYSLGKARDDHQGKYAEFVLQNKNIDLEKTAPFSPVTNNTVYAGHGVVKINNIPFTVSAQEITQFIYRYAPTPMLKKNHDGYPIHIIMEKPTGKTMDCYVEFPTHEAAQECVKRFEYTAHPGRGTKLGTRHVTLDLSNQAELLHAVFPRARLVKFDPFSGKPTILCRQGLDDWSEGFRGYFTLEEVYGVTRFAENPSRSPFVLKCHQRVYECMISTLYKFPWAATHTYTVAARNALFEAAYKQLITLSRKVGCPTGPSAERNLFQDQNAYNPGIQLSESDTSYDLYEDQRCSSYISSPDSIKRSIREVGLNPSLFFDLLFAAVNVPSFNLLQKYALCQAAGSYGRGIPLSNFSETWPFQTLEPSSDTPDHVVKFWLELFDTGFDIMTSEGHKTTFEQYIVFTRNQIGFPIGEWTRAGLDLPFEDAVRVEHAVMMQYVSCGRNAWARERQITVSVWQGQTLFELLKLITEEKDTFSPLQTKESSLMTSSVTDISPKSSLNWDVGTVPSMKDIGKKLDAVSEPSSMNFTQTTRSRLSAATASNFVPGLGIEEEFGDGDERCCSKHNSDERHNKLTINTNLANAGLGQANVFQNPFSGPSSKLPALTSDNSRKASRTTLNNVSPFDQGSPFSAVIRTLRSSSANTGSTSNPSNTSAQRTASLFQPSTRNDIGESFRKLSMAATIPRSKPPSTVPATANKSSTYPGLANPITGSNIFLQNTVTTVGENEIKKHSFSTSRTLLQDSTTLSPLTSTLDDPFISSTRTSGTSFHPFSSRTASSSQLLPASARNLGPIGSKPPSTSASTPSTTAGSNIDDTRNRTLEGRARNADCNVDGGEQRSRSTPFTQAHSGRSAWGWDGSSAYGHIARHGSGNGEEKETVVGKTRLSASELWEGL